MEEIKKMQSELHILVNVLSGRAVWPAGLLENVVLCFCIECGIGCDRISPSMIRVLQGGEGASREQKRWLWKHIKKQYLVIGLWI